MGKWRALLPITLALVVATSGSIFLYKWIQTQTTPKEAVTIESEAVPVAVVAVDLPWGTKLEQEMMKTTLFLKESLPPGYSSDTASLENRVLIAHIKQNEPITKSKLAPENVTNGGISAIVKPGNRAIAVKGDKVIGISGFILPGNRVDVLVTLTEPKTKKEVTKIVLENTLVLATGTQMQEDSKGKPAPVDVYTLEVKPDDAEKLGLASSQGKLQFALRNITDDETVLTRGATITQTLLSLHKASHKVRKIKRGKPRPQRVTMTTVEVIKGDKVTKKNLKVGKL